MYYKVRVSCTVTCVNSLFNKYTHNVENEFPMVKDYVCGEMRKQS